MLKTRLSTVLGIGVSALTMLLAVTLTSSDARAQAAAPPSSSSGTTPVHLPAPLRPTLPRLQLGMGLPPTPVQISALAQDECLLRGYFWIGGKCSQCPVGKRFRDGACRCPHGFLDNGPRLSCRCPANSSVYYTARGAHCRAPTVATSEDDPAHVDAKHGACIAGPSSCTAPTTGGTTGSSGGGVTAE